ncbi:hypothetical protein [Streptomyces sp. NBC_01320]|uniref:hypothetical protein n=1 Tax=Streptomyces sp. NBC_01320 TaxID=2903824 RepID=UPI002E15B274|nr:hypothetical protein OG395_12885 [Streptomyces sp. NBC_01320]
MHASPASSPFSRRSALAVLAGAGAATLLGSGTASARPIDADGKAALAALNLPTPPVDPSTLTD